MKVHRIARIAATGCGIVALAAPAASASPIADQGSEPAPSHPRVVVRSVDNGFDWGSAAVGAGVMLVGAGALGASYRSRIRLAR
jgi:hypothetical protein